MMHIYGGWGETYGNRFSPPTMWVSGFELRLLDLEGVYPLRQLSPLGPKCFSLLNLVMNFIIGNTDKQFYFPELLPSILTDS